jgi:phosphatidylglycerophosphate synthase
MDRVFGPLLRPLDAWFTNHRERLVVRQIPNAITSTRILLSPVLAVLIWRALAHYDGWPPIGLSLALLGLLLASDGLDGSLAYRYRLQSKVGSVLDPTADKVFVISVMTALLLAASALSVPWLVLGAPFVALIALIDLVIVGVTLAEAWRRRHPRADRNGKRKLAFQGGLLALMLAGLWTVAAGAHSVGFVVLALCLPVMILITVFGLRSLKGHWTNLTRRVPA